MIINRSLVYKRANFKINCDNLNKTEIANTIIKKYESKNNKY